MEKEPQYNPSCVVQLPVASNSSIEIVAYALKALQRLYKERYRYKKAGVIISEIVPENQVQIGLFDETDRPKHKTIMLVLDTLNTRFGRETVKLAPCGTGRK